MPSNFKRGPKRVLNSRSGKNSSDVTAMVLPSLTLLSSEARGFNVGGV